MMQKTSHVQIATITQPVAPLPERARAIVLVE